MKLSEKLIKLRKERGLSQEEFGNEINVSRQAVSKWENEEAKPDTDKIQEIVKKFNVSYEYLLNDEIDGMDVDTNNETKTKKKRKGLKIVLIILLVYLLVCTYKFIAFSRFYLVAKSFSEENYSISEIRNIRLDTGSKDIVRDITRIGNEIIEKSYDKESGDISEPYLIEYTDIDNREAYSLSFNDEEGKYIYNDRKEDMISEEEVEELFRDRNDVREYTLDSIPSDFKQIFIASVNPMFYYVDMINREIRWYSITDSAKEIIKLSNDYVLEKINLKTDDGNATNIEYSYDYVQDHFKDRKIEDPLEIYKGKIVFEE